VPERPRLLILITLAEIGGAQTYLTHLLPALTGELDVTVAAYGPGPLRAAAGAAGARYVPLRHVRRPLSPVQDLLGLFELIALFRRVNPQIVHANSSKAGILGRLAAWVARVPSRIFTAHGWAFAAYSGPTSKAYLWADRALRPLTTATICVAEHERRIGIAAGTCDADRTVMIHNAVDVGATPQAKPNEGEVLVVSVGRLKYPKDTRTLLEAAARIPGEWRLEVVGDGPERAALEQLATDVRIRLVGERDDVPALLARSSVFVLSSRSEGLPLSVIEAMAAGLPVVASDVGGLRELVEHEVTGLLVAPGNVDALAEALGRLVADPGLRRRMGDAGRARAELLFDLPAFRQGHLELYRAQLGRSMAPAPRPPR
jgi:glycosyltransferase involved in cell wall biosynthesis